MLEVRNIGFAYKNGPRVLEDISFTLEEGTTTCLLGPNGTGKTTLLKVLLGLLKNDRGTILWNGKDITALSQRERARIIAYVPQFSGLTFPYSAEEVVLMGRLSHLRAGGAPGEGDRRIVREALEHLGIEHLAKKLFHQLSGGEKQMVIIARALAQQSRLLVLDEPTASLDFANQVKAMKTIRKLSKEGYSVLMTSHSPDQAFLVADRAVLMKDGYVSSFGTPDEVVTTEALSSLYGTETQVAECGLNGDRSMKVCIPVL